MIEWSDTMDVIHSNEKSSSNISGDTVGRWKVSPHTRKSHIQMQIARQIVKGHGMNFSEFSKLTMWRLQLPLTHRPYKHLLHFSIEKFRIYMKMSCLWFFGISLKFYLVFIDLFVPMDIRTGIPFSWWVWNFGIQNNDPAHVFLGIHSINGAHMCERVVDKHFNY